MNNTMKIDGLEKNSYLYKNCSTIIKEARGVCCCLGEGKGGGLRSEFVDL